MRFYTQQHRFYCGVDLHARMMYLVVLDAAGNVVLDQDMACDRQMFLKAIAPFRDGMVVGVACMFAWYWLADLCQEHQEHDILRAIFETGPDFFSCRSQTGVWERQGNPVRSPANKHSGRPSGRLCSRLACRPLDNRESLA